nr:lipopolysaccharide biosynthesis protein [uncultured Chitinophaga sp.]
MDISKKKIVQNAVIYTILPKISFIINLLITPVISRYLTLNDFGIYALVLAYVSVFSILIALGLNVVLQNSFFEYKKRFASVWRRCFGIMMIAGVVSAIILGLVMYFTMRDKLGANLIPVGILMAFYLIFSPIETIAVNYFVLNEKPLPYALCAATNGFITILLNLITIKYLRLGYLGWIIVMPVTILTMYIFYFRRFFFLEKIYPVFNLRWQFVKKVLRIGLPLTPHQLSLYVLGTSDRLVLEYFKLPVTQIGFYSQGYTVGAYSNIFINGVFQALARKLQEGFRGEDDVHKRFVRKMLIMIPAGISAVLFVGSIWMKEVFLFLYRKPELQGAYPISIIIVCSYMFWPIYTIFTIPLSIQGKTFSISKISLLAAIFNLIGNIILVPVWGIWASVGVTYCSYLIFGVAGLMNKENREFLDKYVNIAKVTIIGSLLNIALLLISYTLRDSGYLLKIIITIGAGILMVVVYQRGLKAGPRPVPTNV